MTALFVADERGDTVVLARLAPLVYFELQTAWVLGISVGTAD